VTRKVDWIWICKQERNGLLCGENSITKGVERIKDKDTFGKLKADPLG
jgi:hypothetical protein